MASSGMMLSADSLWQSYPAPSFLLNDQDFLDQINSAAEQFTNRSSNRLIGLPVIQVLGVDTPLDLALRRVRRDQSALFIRNAKVTPQGGIPSLCNIQIAPLQGQIGGLLLVLEPHRISEHLARSEGVKASAQAAIGMADMLAHEIKNPLAGIIGAAQLLAMNQGDADREMSDLIVAEGRRIVALLEQVEQFGKLAPPNRQAINIHGLLDLARRSAALGFASQMVFNEDFDPSLPLTHVDPDQMIQVILNLLKNAAEAAGSTGGKITLRTYFDQGLRLRRRDGQGNDLPLQVEIIDDGPGLPVDITGDIFDPFVSGRENGTGLGLALVSKIINDHDGLVSAASQPGRTVFRISLPLAPAGALDKKT